MVQLPFLSPKKRREGRPRKVAKCSPGYDGMEGIAGQKSKRKPEKNEKKLVCKRKKHGVRAEEGRGPTERAMGILVF